MITFNGEIYNYEEIRDELVEKGHSFATHSDTEVILAAYQEWGAACLSKFKGMWAFCIYDKRRQQLFLSRDRFGIKPLYYVHEMAGSRKNIKGGKRRRDGKKVTHSFSFASEINALRGFTVEPRIDREGLSQFFTFRFTLGETTLLEGVKKLLPGHYLLYDLKKGAVAEYKRYYTLKPARLDDEAKRNSAAYRDGLRQRLETAVERRMVADVPVACFLSGGIDSSILTLLAKRHNARLNTFSMGFETTNELPYARLVAEHVGTSHHELHLDERTILDHLDGMIAHMDEPIGDPGFLPMYVLSEEVTKHNKVVLSGDGGDEILTGYDRYKLFHYGWALRHLPVPSFGSDILKRLKAMRGKDEYRAFLEIIRLFEKGELERFGVREADGHAFWNDASRIGRTRVERAQAFDILTLLPGDFFMKADKMSSAFGLEQRVPYLDHELVEYAFALPLNEKLRRWNEKRILKAAYEDELPAAITRRRKHGFNVPIDHWFKGILGDELRTLLAESDHSLYRKAYAYELLDRIRRKGTDYTENFVLAQKLWSILVFERWYENVFKTTKRTNARKRRSAKQHVQRAPKRKTLVRKRR